MRADVLPGQILARIRLGEPHRVRLRTSALNGTRAVEGVEQVAERSRQDAFDLDDLVAARDQVAQRRHDRQPGADVRFVQEMLPPRRSSSISARSALHGSTFARLFGVMMCRFASTKSGYASTIVCVGGAVDQRARWSARAAPLARHERARISSDAATAASASRQRGQVDTVGVEHEPLAVRPRPTTAHVESAAPADTLAARAAAAAARRRCCRRRPRPARACLRVSKNAWWMTFSARTSCARVDHERDVALGGALRDRADVDVVAPSDPNTLPETPGRPFIPSPTTATIVWSGFASSVVSRCCSSKPELVAERGSRRRGVGVAARRSRSCARTRPAR